MDATRFADQLELFFGEASDTLCHVYARLRGVTSAEGFRLSGKLTGPSCLYSRTLEATFRFADRGPGDSLLAAAIVPEPCFWTPDMPHLYQAELVLAQGDHELARTRRPLGLRTLGSEGRKLVYDGKRWVLRAVRRDEVPAAELSAWREADAAMVVSNPDDALCEEASRVGVLLVAELAASQTHELRRLSRWAAVAVAVLPTGAVIEDRSGAPNLLLAERCDESPSAPATWAQLRVCEANASGTADMKLPILASRPAGRQANLLAARAECDRLQRDLAGRGEYSGYVV